MNRSLYFDYIEEKINTLAIRINSRGKLNILDFHLHSENFYRDFLKNLYGWDTKNLNEFKTNVEAIDLVCDHDKIIFQVSATSTKNKIENALKKNIINKYKGYSFKFISISKDASDLRKKTYSNPHNISFDPQKDIYDIALFLKRIINLDIENQTKLYEFIKKELGEDAEIGKLDSNLASIINILSKQNPDTVDGPIAIDNFEIERKISFNNLKSAGITINDYALNHNSVEKIYLEFDKSGVNKSNSVLATIRTEYTKNMGTKSENDLFFIVIDKIRNKIIESPNFVKIPIDELDVCVNTLVVDAFIRCKIFKNPENYKYAITR